MVTTTENRPDVAGGPAEAPAGSAGAGTSNARTTGATTAGTAASAPAARADRTRRTGPSVLRHLPPFGVLLSIALVTAAIVAAFVPDAIAPYSPIEGEILDKLLPPDATHLFGTDHLGRDVFSRVVHGSALSLQATAIAVGLALGVGSVLGLLAGFVGGIVDTIIMRVVDVLLAIPSLLLSLAVVASLGFGIRNVAIAVGIGSVASFARVTRAEALRVRGSDYVEAARILGAGRTSTVLRHGVPNSIGPAIVLAALELGYAVLAVSALSYLGYGEPPPAPEWGKIVAEGRNYLPAAWWITALPSAVIAVVVLAMNRISRWLDTVLGGAAR